ncbi:MAG: cytochrome c, partial [Luteibacter sp.]
KALLSGLDPDTHLQFVALDGFAAELPASLVLGHGAEAWLAIEPPDAPWPALGKDKPGAGPFYLVWLHPEASHVGPEQWPYQIATVRLLAAPATRFPKMRPAADLPPDDPARRGFAVFQRNCLSCHTLNGQGDARLGPDLNIPHSPTEYLREDMLRTLIRNPQDLRHWPQAKMPGFDRDVLSDRDLDDLIAYLKHMAGRKAAP